MHWETRFRNLASTQEGLVARHGLPPGCTLDHWTRARRNGRWHQLSSRVLRADGAPPSDGQRALSAVLDTAPESALHGPSALAWLGLPGFSLGRVQVARQRNTSRRSTSLGQLHRLRDLRPHDVIIVKGVPTETALRAIWSEATRFSAAPFFEIGVERIGRLLDDAHTRGLVTWLALHELVEDIHRRGRAGSTIMRELAMSRQPGSSPTESRNEDQFESILRTASVRLPRRQVSLGGREPIGRCDFADDEQPAVFEVNSLSYHSTPSDRAADRLRYQHLTEAGFSVGVVWEDDLWSHQRDVVGLVRAVRRSSKSGSPTILHSPSCPWPHDVQCLEVHRAVPPLPYRG